MADRYRVRNKVLAKIRQACMGLVPGAQRMKALSDMYEMYLNLTRSHGMAAVLVFATIAVGLFTVAAVVEAWVKFYVF